MRAGSDIRGASLELHWPIRLLLRRETDSAGFCGEKKNKGEERILAPNNNKKRAPAPDITHHLLNHLKAKAVITHLLHYLIATAPSDRQLNPAPLGIVAIVL